MRLAAGCSDTQVSFENASVGGYTNAGAPTDNSCHVFHASGGGVSWQDPPAGSNDGSDWRFEGDILVHTRDGSNSSATIDVDLVMFLPAVTQSVCETINNGLGITGVPVNGQSFNGNEKFLGTYNLEDNVTGLSDLAGPDPCIAAPGTGLCGKLSGCFKEEEDDQRYIFYNVLISR